MSKRSREQPVEFIYRNDLTEVRYNDKVYCWDHPANYNFEKLMQDPDCEFTILHNYENKAMLNVQNIRTDETIIRFKINPIEFAHKGEWVVDSKASKECS